MEAGDDSKLEGIAEDEAGSNDYLGGKDGMKRRASFKDQAPRTSFTALNKPARITEDAFGFYEKKDLENKDPNELQPPQKKVVKRYTFINNSGVRIQLINYGATITSLRMQDQDGIEDDVVLGFDDLEGYINSESYYFGATIGRVAGLTSGGVITIDKDYYLSTNFGDHHLNGGFNGFGKVLWDSYIDKDKVIMTHVSPDGDEGYPGCLTVQLTFQLAVNNMFIIYMKAVASQPTPISISNHAYFNLAGHGKGPEGLKEHCLMVNADRFIKRNFDTRLVTGILENVGSTFYDLRIPRPLDKILTRVPGGGYNDTFCLTKGHAKKACTFAARLVHPESGRFLEIVTDHPGLHVYTANDLPNPDEPIATSLEPSFDLFAPIAHDEDDFFSRKSETEYPRPESDPEEEHVFKTYSGIPSKVASHSINSEKIFEDQSKVEDEGTPEEEKYEYEEGALADECDKSDSSEDEFKPEIKTVIEEIQGKMGCSYRNHSAIILMPMEYPDALKYPHFPKSIVRPGETYERTIVYKVGLLPPAKTVNLIEIAENVPAPSDNVEALVEEDSEEDNQFKRTSQA